MSGEEGSADYSVVVITRDRRAELARTLTALQALPEHPAVLVVDNGSTDGTVAAVRRDHPNVTLLTPGRNLGAVGRNLAVAQVATPYVAFCDDDTWWEPDAPGRAAALLASWPRLAAVTGRIVVEPGGDDDPVCAELAASPVPGPPWLPGPVLLSLLAGATMLRTAAFREAGGFHPRLWLGGEEELLGADLAAAGWWCCYCSDVVVHHQASTARDPRQRRRHGIRNTLWFAWLRRPVLDALGRTAWLARSVPRDRTSVEAFADAARGLPWVLRERRVLPGRVAADLRLLEAQQRGSVARRYVG